MWLLLNEDRMLIQSKVKGTLGGNRKTKIYGKLDCPIATKAILKGGYIKNRVFFLNEDTAKLCGYRPCAICMKNQYILWKSQGVKNEK